MRKPKGVVGVGTVTDPYQPLEKRLKLTRKCIEVLTRKGFPVSIQTKSKLVLRDLHLLKSGNVDVGLTITTMDERLASLMEPGASKPIDRAEALKVLSEEGVETWLFLGPIIPGLNDSEDSIRRVVEVAYEVGCELIYDQLNLRRWVLDRLKHLLDRVEPGLGDRVPLLLRPDSWYLRRLHSIVEKVCREYGVRCVRFRYE